MEIMFPTQLLNPYFIKFKSRVLILKNNQFCCRKGDQRGKDTIVEWSDRFYETDVIWYLFQKQHHLLSFIIYHLWLRTKLAIGKMKLALIVMTRPTSPATHIWILRTKRPTSQMQKHEAWTLEHGLNKQHGSSWCVNLKVALPLWAPGAAGDLVMATGLKTYASNSCCTCMCTHTHMQDLYTQRAIVNSWQGFYCCITPDTQIGEQIMSHGNLDCQTLI